jgi:hypothetical protein
MKAALIALAATLGSASAAAHKRHDAFHRRDGWESVPSYFQPECCKTIVTVTVYGSSMSSVLLERFGLASG